MTQSDTIAAVATPPGKGGVGIIRVSGPAAAAIAHAVLGTVPAARAAVLIDFLAADGSALDRGLALHFPAPHSFTGEDVLELHGHGGPVVMQLLLERVLALGARIAEPGEFTLRAFLNDKMDLAQAEAVADLVEAGSAQAARAATRSLQGEFSARVHALVEELAMLRVWVEAAIDFPEEEVDFLADEKLLLRINALRERFDALTAAARQGRLLRDGMSVVIAGAPNAGKSSLLNRLAGYDAAIVSDQAGTTRDVLRERIDLDGLPLHVIDTAGLRDSADAIEQEGIRRAHAEIQRADRVLLLVDDSVTGRGDTAAAAGLPFDVPRDLPADVPLSIVHNKCDLSGAAPRCEDNAEVAHIYLSALTGAGVDELREHLKACMGYQVVESGSLIARARHIDALRRARAYTEEGWRRLQEEHAGELLAEELRYAQDALGEITGAISSDDLLGRIFSSFCIGK